jgi:hypothetical protein
VNERSAPVSIFNFACSRRRRYFDVASHLAIVTSPGDFAFSWRFCLLLLLVTSESSYRSSFKLLQHAIYSKCSRQLPHPGTPQNPKYWLFPETENQTTGCFLKTENQKQLAGGLRRDLLGSSLAQRN